MSVFRFLMKNLMSLRLHPSLKPHIQKQLFSALGPKLQLMLESKLHAHLIPDNVHNSLWFSEVRHIAEHAIRAEITNTVWDVIWDTVGGTGSGIDMFQVTQEVSQARFAEGHPGNEAQFSALWNAAIYAALEAVYRSARGKIPDGVITRETIFDDAWCTARDSALLAAQAVVQDTGPKLNNPKRDVMWEKVWEAWGPAWGAAQARARGTVLTSVNNMANALVDSVVKAIILEIAGSHLSLSPVKVDLEVSINSSLFQKQLLH
ncbi:hypothetical protein FRC12_003492 [Ceratobasidium sp. 428]|nr:hypothetical protein FRC12_003492 [Ceratobasidium sp. 428]